MALMVTSQVRMAEGVEDFRRAFQAADGRHIIGQGRPRADPTIRRFGEFHAELIEVLREPRPFARIGRRAWIAELQKARACASRS